MFDILYRVSFFVIEKNSLVNDFVGFFYDRIIVIRIASDPSTFPELMAMMFSMLVLFVACVCLHSVLIAAISVYAKDIHSKVIKVIPRFFWTSLFLIIFSIMHVMALPAFYHGEPGHRASAQMIFRYETSFVLFIQAFGCFLFCITRAFVLSSIFIFYLRVTKND